VAGAKSKEEKGGSNEDGTHSFITAYDWIIYLCDRVRQFAARQKIIAEDIPG
jgi:hypothetical protein